ncbi:MAG: Nitrogen-fixing NifU domain protein [Candidatus Kaiserbacteria bacterium GW2011_GWA2_58_9]|uniref:Nitrogen-fixing NifU domain protein n=2 Tax=Candidatus Kaiseribacteriota TaxID=1752734 RepID=A0A0G1YXM9_9BACT|nr:MAG: Nitrogen-fixing NifU domain protein [Candidatus Kaiserbacteria bacterium GW2011_GWA2_58_9]
MDKKTEEMIKAVEEVLKQFQPLFEEHGGGAELMAVEEDEVVLRLIGNCVGCDAAGLHFGAGVELMIKERLPSIKKISYSY